MDRETESWAEIDLVDPSAQSDVTEPHGESDKTTDSEKHHSGENK